MKKMLALLAVLCSATAAFAQFHEDDAVARWKQSSATSPFPITMPLVESTPGPLLGARSAEGLASI